MKKLFLLLALLGIVATGCSKDEVDKGNDNKTEQPNENEGNNEEPLVFEVDSDGNYNVEAEGGEVLLAVTTNLEYSVYIPKDARSWIFYEETRAVRSETVVLSVEPNDNTELRTATIELRDAQGKALDKFNIIQKPKAVEEEESVFEIDAEGSYTIPAEGAEIEVTITTNLEYRVEVSEDAKAWLSIGDTRAVRTETLIFTVAKNESDRERTATITIFNKDDEKVFEFRLTQKFNDKADIPEYIFFGLDKESFTFSPDGGSVDVIVYSNYKWEILGTSDWCTPSAKSGDANEDGQKVTFSADVAYDDREAIFWFRCADKQEKFVVSQKLKEVIISDANNTFNIPAEGGVAVISYQTSVDCEVIIPQYAQSWITIAPTTRGLVGESITLNVAENTTYSSRTAVIKVVAKDNAELAVEYTINQEQNDAVLANGNTEFTISGRKQQITIKHKANVDCDVIIPDEAQDWVTIAPATRGLSIYSTTLNIAENNSGEEKSCVIKVVSQEDNELFAEYTINQHPRYYLYYTSSDGNIVEPYSSSAFGATIISNTYKDGVGAIDFNAPITTIGDYAFYNCSRLTSVTIPDSVTTIGVYAFYNCSRLTSVTIPDSVTTIGGGAFEYCSSLTSVTIPDSVTTIKGSAFSDCNSLTSITIPDSVTSIGNFAFSYCSSLTSVTIGDSVTTIGENAFRRCSSLTSVYINDIAAWCNISFSSWDSNPLWYAGNLYLNNELVTDLIIPDSVTTIGNYAFYNCNSLTGVTIPDSVTTIGNSAFYSCDSLTSVTIPDSVTSIGNSTFYSCDSLISVTIPDSVTEIGSDAFCGCKSLTSVTIGDSVTTIGKEAFYSCSNLQEFKGKFASEDGRCLIIDGVLNSFAIGCGATEYTIPDSVTTIGESAFYNCSSLTSVTIGDSVTSIGNSAFYSCSSLISVTIPDSVTEIGSDAFCGCKSLTSVYCKATTPPSLGVHVFLYLKTSSSYRYIGCKIYVPMESVEAYKSASNWSDYADDIVGYNF